jgi:pSer/pThr/pTyr-binding forkhead associated (FHA) protein
VHATFRPDAPVTVGRVALPDGQTVVLLDGITLIGRDPNAPVRLVDSRVSRRHAEIEASAGSWTLRDLGSTNGTTVNDEPVDRAELRDGDEVGIGGVPLRFSAS